MPQWRCSDPVRVGLIGAGSASRAYLRTLDSMVVTGAAVEGPVCDHRSQTRAELVGRRPATQTVATPEEVFAEVDLVVITTAPDSHADLTRRALESGRHVMVEKPLAADPDVARGLVKLARERELLLVVAPFVQLSPAFRALWTWVQSGVLGDVHSARAMYGNAGASWAPWYHTSGVGPLGDLAVYNIKSLTALLGPAVEVRCMQSRSSVVRDLPEGVTVPDPDVVHLTLRHESGATSVVMASHAVWAYRRPAIELYGSEGSANLLGDDWDPEGIEVYRAEWGHWRSYASPDHTWNWTDGLRAAVHALRTGDAEALDLDHDLHVLDVVVCARESAGQEGAPVPVSSHFGALHLTYDVPGGLAHVHDHTRPLAEQ